MIVLSLIIDRRETGITEALTKLRDVEHTVMHLDSADCRFFGLGEAGECVVGCERKRLSDLINSMRQARLNASQMPKIVTDHDYAYLFLEGIWRPGLYGEIEEYRNGKKGMNWYPVYGTGEKFAVTYAQIMSYVTSLENLEEFRCISTGETLRTRRTANAHETASQYCALWHWYQKPWDKHKTGRKVYSNVVVTTGRRARLSGLSPRRPPSELWMMAAQLPGVDERARAVAGYFRSIRAMANSTVRDWASIPGVGKIIAERVVKIIREECEEDGTKTS